MGLQDDVWPSARSHAESPGRLNHEAVDLVSLAVCLNPSVYDLDQDASEDGPVEHFLQAVIGFLVGLTGPAEQEQGVVQGFHDVVDLGNRLVLPLLNLSLLDLDALLFGLQNLDRDGVSVEELDELLLLGV